MSRGARELALLRLVAQGLAGPRAGTPLAVAERLLCLQAQDYWSGLASVQVRCGAARSETEAAFDAGEIVRAWPLRGTLHLLAAADLHWLRELLAPRQLAAARLREQRLGLDAALIARATEITTATLTRQGPCSRAELNHAWTAAGIDSSGQRSYHLIWHLAHAGTIVLGPTRAGRQMFALSERWLPPASGLARDDALARLARRYFTGHGPATLADLTRWASITVADARQAIAGARGELETLTVDGAEYLIGPETRDALAGDRRAAEAVIALPHFDELLLGYRDRDPTLPAERDLNVFAGRNGMPACTILKGGQVIATWKRPAAEVTPLAKISASALTRAARLAGEISRR